MRITALVENTSDNPEIRCEHGLSLYIETEAENLLFDFGQSELFEQNAEKLGIDLSNVDIAVLSHGHYDHGGGLKRFLEINKKAPVYLNRYAFEPHYNGTEKYIGLDTELLNNERLVFTDEHYEIRKGLALYSCNESAKRWKFDSSGLNASRNGVFYPEDFRHEHYLLIEENGRRVLISGCSHKGIINIAEHFRPDVLIGGFHFMKLELSDDLRLNAERLSHFPTLFYTCHCTGKEQYEFMKPFMKRLRYISCGKTVEIQSKNLSARSCSDVDA